MKTETLPVLLSVLIFSQVGFAQSCARLKDISAGETHTLALADDNSLWVCGAGPLGLGDLGDGVNKVLSLKRVHGPNDVGYLNNIVSFDAGWEHSLAVDSNSFCWAWGDDGFGKLGNGPNEGSSDFPIRVHGVNNDVNGLRNIVVVSAGRSGRHSLAVDVNGYVYAWGYNYYGQCGDGGIVPGVDKQFPVPVVDSNEHTTDKYLGNEANIIDVDAGVDHSLALDDEGYVWQWGFNSSIPHKVPDENGTGYLRYIIDIATCDHSVAVDSNGNVWTWLIDDYPEKVAGLENIVAVSAGGSYLCTALDINNNVWQWTIGSQPMKVPDGQMETESGYLENIVAVDAGFNDFRVAVSSDGYGWAWGVNGDGRLGVGDTNSRPEPNQMLCAEVSGSIYLIKTSEIEGDEPDCVRPFTGNNYLVYEINCGNLIGPNSCGTVHNVNIIDHLPLEVNFYSASDGGEYNADTNTVTWTIDELAPGDSNCFTLTVTVNEYAQPSGEITNFVEMTADEYYSYATDTVPVCYWGTEIIYVDHDATNGHNNGTDWDNAYTDLRAAFIGAQNSSADATAIWVAAGTYKPTYDMNTGYTLKSFELPDNNFALIGHFGGIGTYETNPNQRNFADANNETILEGRIGSSVSQAVQHVVKAQYIENANVVVDGFTIKGSYSENFDGAGIYLNDANVSIVNCKLKNNQDFGIYAINSSAPDIHNCTFIGNRYYGMRVDQSSRLDISYSVFDGNDANVSGVYMRNYGEVSVSSSIFKRHTSYGIDADNGTLTVTDSNFDDNLQGGMLCSNSDLTVDHSVIADNNHNEVGIGLSMANNCLLTLTNSVVRNNGESGLNLNGNSTVTIKNNWIYSNGTDGLYLDDNLTATIKNNWIYDNGYHGLYLTDHSTATIKNNWIYDNPYGIYIFYTTSAVTIRNNTIFCHTSLENRTCGIYTEIDSTEPEPNISNCILWDNRNDLDNCVATYSCIQNPDDADGIGNTTDNPCFFNPAADDFHLNSNSPCKNNGDPSGNYSDETDIDGENRVYYSRVDIGADEYYYFDEDGIVNFKDYAVFARAWWRKSGDANYNENCDLVDNNAIDFNDLALFCESWLLERLSGDEGWMMAMGGGGGRGTDGELMLLDAAASLKASPERLIAKTQKFYDITPETTISAIQNALELQLQLRHQAKSKPKPEVQFTLESLQPELQPQLTEVDIQKLVDWLDEIWLKGELEDWTEDKYLEFRKSIEDSLQ